MHDENIFQNSCILHTPIDRLKAASSIMMTMKLPYPCDGVGWDYCETDRPGSFDGIPRIFFPLFSITEERVMGDATKSITFVSFLSQGIIVDGHNGGGSTTTIVDRTTTAGNASRKKKKKKG